MHTQYARIFQHTCTQSSTPASWSTLWRYSLKTRCWINRRTLCRNRWFFLSNCSCSILSGHQCREVTGVFLGSKNNNQNRQPATPMKKVHHFFQWSNAKKQLSCFGYIINLVWYYPDFCWGSWQAIRSGSLLINQETLDEHCRDLADQLCKSPAVTGSGKLPRRVTGVGLVRPDLKNTAEVDQTSSISSPTNLRQVDFCECFEWSWDVDVE